MRSPDSDSSSRSTKTVPHDAATRRGYVGRMTNSLSWASSVGRRRNMQAIRSRDTSHELAVRRLVHAAGLRYRVNFAPLPGLRRTADLVFTRQRIAVFLDGCFWHGCPVHKHEVRQNGEYWAQKLRSNVARDIDTNRKLETAGWTLLRFWEHEDSLQVSGVIVRAVREHIDELHITSSWLPNA
jgi:DNA mismatch endonuclease (patch repair protein)